MSNVPSANQFRRFIVGEKKKQPKYDQNPNERFGTVDASYGRTDPKIPVIFDGEDVAVLLPTTVEASPGNRVLLNRRNNQWIVTGVIGDFDWFYVSNIAGGFGTGWINYGGGWESCKIRKDPAGIVHLEGMLKTTIGPNANTMFTLPPGFRPGVNRIQLVASNNIARRLFISSTGIVNLYQDTGVAANDFVSLSGISFQSAP